MKKFLITFLFFWGLSNWSYSQYAYNEFIKNDSQRKKVAQIKSCNQVLTDGKGLHSFNEYDSSGNLIYTKTWFNGELQYERKYFYNEKGLLSKMINDKDKPYNLYTAYYEYDKDGLLVGEKRVSNINKNREPLTFKYIHDDDKNLIIELFEQGMSDYYTYENGKKVKKEKRELNGTLYSITYYKYNENSVMEEEYDSKGKFQYGYERIFDRNEFLKEVISYDENKNIRFRSYYEYDAWGNPLKRYNVDKNGEMNIGLVYEYEYFE